MPSYKLMSHDHHPRRPSRLPWSECVILKRLLWDSDSLIQEYGNLSGTGEHYTYCWRHPKVRENWRTVLAAVTLLVIGTGLIAMGAYAIAEPHNGSQAAVFFVAGFICFVPGAYHVVYIWLAARGYRGFDFYHLPLFT
uniref:Transmembrane protein 134 n=2 Tax=Culex pipiens TaxID=7175 RepID=A0A8D8AQR4_CULPI